MKPENRVRKRDELISNPVNLRAVSEPAYQVSLGSHLRGKYFGWLAAFNVAGLLIGAWKSRDYLPRQ